MADANVEFSPASALFVLILLGVSTVGFITWIARWARQGYVLPYESRRPAPWRAWGALPALILTLMGVGAMLSMRAHEATSEAAATEQVETVEQTPLDPQQFLNGHLTAVSVQLAMLVGLVVLLVGLAQANARDFGLPRSLGEFGRDIGLGLWVGFAAIIPIFVVQALAISLLGIPAGHPLLDQLQENPDYRLFLAAAISAVIAAPIVEEFCFRVVLQGGLESQEDALLAESHPAEPAEAELGTEQPGDTPLLAPGSELWDEPTPEVEDLPPVAPRGLGVLPGLGRGWAPILASSFIFAMAHLGSGPSPVPLFVFAMFLGYVYQRTHRLVPSIVAHMVLNATSIGMLFLFSRS